MEEGEEGWLVLGVEEESRGLVCGRDGCIPPVTRMTRPVRSGMVDLSKLGMIEAASFDYKCFGSFWMVKNEIIYVFTFTSDRHHQFWVS